MAEAIAVVASVVAVIQITDRIANFCRHYLGSVRDAPSDIRLILLETTALNTIFENLRFLNTCKQADVSKAVRSLAAPNGPIEGCKRAVTELEQLLPTEHTSHQTRSWWKKRKAKVTLTSLAWPMKESNARKLLEEIGRCKLTINLALSTDSFQDIKHIKQKTADIHDTLFGVEQHEICQWLACTDPSPLHNTARSQHTRGTGDWIFEYQDWRDWIDAKCRCLWIHGIPGAGKTVLISHVIQHIQTHCQNRPNLRAAYTYYYCYFGRNQNEAAPFLRWLLNQLCRRYRRVTGDIYELYKRGTEPSIIELLQALEEVLNQFDIVYVVVDALDESTPRDKLLKVVGDLITDFRFSKLQFLASSREYTDIEKTMKKLSKPISMANPSVQGDIRLHIRSLIASNRHYKRWPKHLIDEVEEAVSSRAQGMFRWAACQIDALQRLKSEPEIIGRALRNLPKTLYETYDRIILTIPEDERLYVYQVLQWISFTRKLQAEKLSNKPSISLNILVTAAAKSTARFSLVEDERFYDADILRELCGCLVQTRKLSSEDDVGRNEDNTDQSEVGVIFAHNTVWEYVDTLPARLKYLFPEPSPLLTSEKDLAEAHNLLEFVFLESQSMPPRTPTNKDIMFREFCLTLALKSMSIWAGSFGSEQKLTDLAISLLDPCLPHFEHFARIARQTLPFWNPAEKLNLHQGNTAHLLYLLLVERNYMRNLEFPLATRYLLSQKSRSFLATPIANLFVNRNPNDHTTPEEATIFELFAHSRRDQVVSVFS